MTVVMSDREYADLRKIVVSLNNENVATVWNRLFSQKHTARSADGSIVMLVDEATAVQFFGILTGYSKSFSALMSKGFRVTDLSKWRTLLSSMGDAIVANFNSW